MKHVGELLKDRPIGFHFVPSACGLAYCLLNEYCQGQEGWAQAQECEHVYLLDLGADTH